MLRASLTLGLVVGAGLPAVLLVLRLGGGERFIAEAVAGAVLSLSAALLGLVPVWVASRWGGPDGPVQGVLVGLVVRLGLTVGGVAALASASSLGALAVAVPTLGWYLGLLLVEIVLLHRFLLRAGSVSRSVSQEEAAW